MFCARYIINRAFIKQLDRKLGFYSFGFGMCTTDTVQVCLRVIVRAKIENGTK